VIRAWRYREGTDQPEAIEGTALPQPSSDALLWIDCVHASDDELELLGAHLRLSKFVIEDLQQGEHRTKLDRYGDHFHIAVHDCELRGDLDDLEANVELAMREIDLVFGDGWLLSVCQENGEEQQPHPPIDAVRRTFERQRGADGTTEEGFLLWALLDMVVDRYLLVNDAVDDRLDALQEVVLDDDVDRIRRGRPRQLFDTSKSLLRFRRAALPLREVIGQLLRRDVPNIGPVALAHFQDLYDHILLVADLTESQRDVLTGLRDADLAVTSNQMSLVQQKIASWGALLLIATLITGFLGMNFRDAPDVSWEEGFLWIGGVVLVLGGPMYLYFRRRKWL